MSYEGFWVHRGSNDIVFVVTKGEDYVIDKFGVFLNEVMVAGFKSVHAYDRHGSTTQIYPNWNKLISIEVQTKKWVEHECNDLHVKFYFDKATALGVLKGKFKEKNYQKNLSSIAGYWRDGSVSHPNVVFSADDDDEDFNTIVTDSIVKGLDVLRSYSLPRNKNVYIITDEYRELIKSS